MNEILTLYRCAADEVAYYCVTVQGAAGYAVAVVSTMPLLQNSDMVALMQVCVCLSFGYCFVIRPMIDDTIVCRDMCNSYSALAPAVTCEILNLIDRQVNTGSICELTGFCGTGKILCKLLVCSLSVCDEMCVYVCV